MPVAHLPHLLHAGTTMSCSLQVAAYMQGELSDWAFHYWACAQRHQAQDEAFALIRSEVGSLALELHQRHPAILGYLYCPIERWDADLATMPAALQPLASVLMLHILHQADAMELHVSAAPRLMLLVLEHRARADSQSAHTSSTSGLEAHGRDVFRCHVPDQNLRQLQIRMQLNMPLPRQRETALLTRAAACAANAPGEARTLALSYAGTIRRARGVAAMCAQIPRHLALLRRASLVSLDVSGVWLRDAGLQAMIQPLAAHSALTAWNLSSTLLRRDGATHLAAIVRGLPKLRILNASRCWRLGMGAFPLDNESMNAAADLAAALAAAAELETLKLGEVHIASHARFLLPVSANTRLRDLDLAGAGQDGDFLHARLRSVGWYT